MKKILICLCLTFCLMSSQGQEKDSMLVVFWNVENFFDYMDQGTGESDREFSSAGSRHWTKRRFYAKSDDKSKSILWIGENHGRMPDLIGMAEVENRNVLYRLLDYTLLRKFDYGFVHYDSGDRRGIDVALLYRKSSFEIVDSSIKTPKYEGEKLPTRDILHVKMRTTKGNTFNFIVNHHPSKFGGERESEGRRYAAMMSLKEICDSLEYENIVAMGDFNDTPDAETFAVMNDLLANKGTELHERREGTIRYEGKWELIDMFLVSRELECSAEMEILRIPFLMTWEKKHPGEKPLRTYSGPRYIGGVSDHCPIVLRLF